MRLIDADALIDAMTGACNIFDAHEVDTTIARTLITVAAKAPTVGDWISVKDRLPETRHAVLVYTPHHKNIWAVSMHEDGNWYIWSPYGRVYLEPDWHGPITHWMPLPEPPKERDENDAADRR